jgi:thioredoxin reductase (NADPH)
LGDAQLEILLRYGREQAIAVGDVLFADGDETYDLIVVLEGVVDIVEGYGQPGENALISYGQREFLGEMGLLTGQHAYLTAVVRAPGRIIRVPSEHVHLIM